MTSQDELVSFFPKLRDSSPGLDGITNKVLKGVITSSPEGLVGYVNHWLRSCTFPEELKYGVVKPIPKPIGADGVPSGPSPVTLLTTMGKLVERCIAVRLKKEMRNIGLVLEGQFGAKRGVSAADALHSSLLDVRMVAGVSIFLDMSKAFDRLVHVRLLHTMQEYGFSLAMRLMIQSYLANRRICTLIDGVRSQWYKPEHGGPQGSVLLPMLYLIYIQPFLDSFLHFGGVKISAFVDDIRIVVSSQGDPGLDRSMLTKVLEVVWCVGKSLNLVFNTNKTVLFPHGFQAKGVFRFGDSLLPLSRQVRYMGLWIDRRLTFNYAVKVLTRKWKQKIASLRFCRRLFHPSQRRDMVRGYLWRSMRYFLPHIYHDLSNSNKGHIERVWRKVMRVIEWYPMTLGSHDVALEFQIMAPGRWWSMSI